MGEGQAYLIRSSLVRWAVWVYVASGLGCGLSLESSGAPAPTRRLPLGSARSRLRSLRLKSPEVGTTPQLSSNFCFLGLRVSLGPKDTGPRQAVVAGVDDPLSPPRATRGRGGRGRWGGCWRPARPARWAGGITQAWAGGSRVLSPEPGAGGQSSPDSGRGLRPAAPFYLRSGCLDAEGSFSPLCSAAGIRLPESWGCWAAGPGGVQGAGCIRDSGLGVLVWEWGAGGERHVGGEGGPAEPRRQRGSISRWSGRLTVNQLEGAPLRRDWIRRSGAGRGASPGGAGGGWRSGAVRAASGSTSMRGAGAGASWPPEDRGVGGGWARNTLPPQKGESREILGAMGA